MNGMQANPFCACWTTTSWILSVHHIPAGTVARFEPGESREVKLVPFGGPRWMVAFQGFGSGSQGDLRSLHPFPIPAFRRRESRVWAVPGWGTYK